MKANLAHHQLKGLSHLALAYLPGKLQRSSIHAFLQDDNSEVRMMWMIKHARNHNVLFKSYLENKK